MYYKFAASVVAVAVVSPVDGAVVILRNGIMITCPCNIHPLTPYFYIVKLGFTGISIIFLVLL